MPKNTPNEDADIDLIVDEIASITVKAPHERKVGKKTIKVRGSVEVARDDYKRTKKLHRAEIRRLRTAIRSHRLMIKQAKNAYKLVKLSDKK